MEFYREEAKIFLAVRQGVTAVKTKLLSSVGDILGELRLLRAGGLVSLIMSFPKVLLFLDENYIEPSEDELSTKFTAVATFRSDAPKMKATFQKLADSGHEISALPKMTHLQDATADLLLPIVEALKDYKKEVTSVKFRSFDDMVAYVKEHFPLTTAGSASYVGVVATRAGSTAAAAAKVSAAPPTTASNLPAVSSTLCWWCCLQQQQWQRIRQQWWRQH